ncbi:hypothetical protein P4U43_13380 [Arthrobacter sp. EH-1B-1]|uniref:Uncharacterized protein n=1 Tax=Arthrobacter vasquezii TaxID=2977629 RepID=A0ABT6CXG2_9MICC|nr:hypothetical protein [Arthrobacter vasquezii]MDF9278779.1 hypothetical protein [Arthrobacter vasquezii]
MQRAHRHDELTAMIEWPRPLSPQALKIIKNVLLGVLVVTALVQIIPFQVLGGLVNHLFTILLLLSWAGPARRFLRRRAAERNGDANEGRNEEREGPAAPEEK